MPLINISRDPATPHLIRADKITEVRWGHRKDVGDYATVSSADFDTTFEIELDPHTFEMRFESAIRLGNSRE